MTPADHGLPPRFLLRRAREERHWTRPDLIAELEEQEVKLGTGERLQLDPKLVQKWERGDVCPRIFYQARICLLFDSAPEVLGVPPSPRLSREIRRLGTRLGPEGLSDAARARRRNAGVGEMLLGDASTLPNKVIFAGVELDTLEAVTVGYGKAQEVVPPSALHDAVQRHLDGLLDLQRRCPPAEQTRVSLLAAKTAIIAGWLAFKLGRSGRAMAHWTLAHGIAVETGSCELEASASACRRSLTLLPPEHC